MKKLGMDYKIVMLRCLPVVLFCCLLFTACTRDGMKTIVLDAPEKTGTGGEGTNNTVHLENSKIYKYNSFNILDDEAVTEEMLGWIDRDNTATLLTRMQNGGWESILESVHYKFHFSKEIIKISSDILSYAISPEGGHLAYLKADQRLYVRDLKTQAEVLVLEPDEGAKGKGGTLTWSNNGRFLCFSSFGKSGGQSGLFVYDVQGGPAHPVQLDSKAVRLLGLYDSTVSDDGSKLLVTARTTDNSYREDYFVALYDLDRETYTTKGDIQVGENLMSSCSFLNEDTLIFFNSRTNALSLLDTGTGSIVELSRDVSYFKASGDGNNLLLGKSDLKTGIRLYVARIKDGKLEDEKLVCEDFAPESGAWSPDNRKILLSGRYQYQQSKEAAAAGQANNTLQSIIIELN